MATGEVIPTYSYEGIKDPNLRQFLEQRVEPAIQQVIGWPIQTSKVRILFFDAFKLDPHQVFNIVATVERANVIALERRQEGNVVRSFLGPDEVRIIGALSWECTERGDKKTRLVERIGKVAEALGDHPLREKLNSSFLPPKSSTPTLPPSKNNGQRKEKPQVDKPDIVIERPSLISVPHMDEQELEAGESWTLEELKKLLSHIPEDWEEVNYPRILHAVGGHPYTHATSQQIMFIGAAWATDPRELWLLDEILEDLNNDQLRQGIRRCIAMLGVRPDIKNLTELFQKSVMRVQGRQQNAHDSSN